MLQKTFYEHLQALQEVLRRIREACQRVSVKKVELCKDAVNYVGLYISDEGLQPKDTHKNHIIQFFGSSRC
jgi:hypothetical protein